VSDLGDRLEEEFNRQIGMLKGAVEEHGGDDGTPPPWITAQADQLWVAARGACDQLVDGVQKHVAANHPCCTNSPDCIGIGLMVGTSVAFKEAPTSMIPAAWSAWGQLARAKQRIAELEKELEERDG